MDLHEKIKNDLKSAMKEKDKKNKGIIMSLRVIIGEFPRLNLKADETPTDEQVFDILRKLQKAEKIIMDAHELDKDTVFLKVVESYLPQLMSEEKITSFINSNIDVGSFKNIMQAMRPIMKQLKGKADGNTVKAVLMKMS